MDDTRILRLPLGSPNQDASAARVGNVEGPRAAVAHIADYRARRAAKVKTLPLFDEGHAALDDGPEARAALPAPATRALSDRDVAHRQRMLRHLLGR